MKSFFRILEALHPHRFIQWICHKEREGNLCLIHLRKVSPGPVLASEPFTATFDYHALKFDCLFCFSD